MVAPYKIKLYGSNETLIADNDSLVTLASLVSLTDLVSIELNVWGYYETNIDEGSEIKGIEGTKTRLVQRRRAWKFPIEQIDIKTGIADYRSINDMLGMDNLFITQVVSPYDVALHATNKAIAVYVEDEQSDTGGYWNITLHAERRKPDA